LEPKGRQGPWGLWDLRDLRARPVLAVQPGRPVPRVLPVPPGRRGCLDQREQLDLKVRRVTQVPQDQPDLKDLKVIPAPQERPVLKEQPDQLELLGHRDPKVTRALLVQQVPRDSRATRAPQGPQALRDQRVTLDRRERPDRPDLRVC
jgi:hypothetical protein